MPLPFLKPNEARDGEQRTSQIGQRYDGTRVIYGGEPTFMQQHTPEPYGVTPFYLFVGVGQPLYLYPDSTLYFGGDISVDNYPQIQQLDPVDRPRPA
jgi:hypothetical protein